MKFPSVQKLVQSAWQTIRRFPLPISFVLIACYYSIQINHAAHAQSDHISTRFFEKMVMTSYLGMLLTLVLTIFSEKRKLPVKFNTIFQVLALGLVITYYYSLPNQFNFKQIEQYILFIIALHLMVAFMPFISTGEMNGFWQYNKVLFLRILTSALYSAVIYVGLSLGLLAMDKLFGLNIDFKWYGDLWVCVAGIFNTVFFLAGFPQDYVGLEGIFDYPRGLKIFTQYVLIPIITIYLLILYAYTFKILFSWQWPFGWVSYLVLAFAISGILSLLLIHPIRYEENNKWIPGYNKFFYIAMCPLIILLFLAIKRRIGDYGFTEERYFDFVLACWLALVCLYFLISKTKNIKLIPISLCVVVLFSSFGPWGAFSVSLRSQMGRLNHYLGKNNMLNAGKIVPVKDTIPTKDENEISSITTYIVNVHGYHGLQGIFAQNLDSLIRPKGEKVSEYSFDESGKIIALMNLRNAESYNIGGKYFNYSASGAKAVTNISGFDYLIKNFEPIGNMSSPDSVVNTFDRELKLTVYPRTGKLFVQATNGMPIQLDLVALIKSITDSTNYDYKKISQDSLTLNSESQRLSVKCLIQEIDGNIYKDSIKIGHLTADILIKLK